MEEQWSALMDITGDYSTDGKKSLVRYQRQVLWLSSVAPLCTLLLHFVTPGGVVGSHPQCVTTVAGVLLCGHIWLALQRWPSGKVRVAFSTIMVFLIGTAVFHVFAVLFGAKVLRQFWDTVCWSLLMSSLTALPQSQLAGTGLNSWLRHMTDQSKLQSRISVVSMATVMGAWLGALPILLDWNRPWQVWPIPCSIGALVGCSVGLVATTLFSADRSSKIL